MGVFHADRRRSYCIKSPRGDSWPKHIACFHVKCQYLAKNDHPNAVHMPNLKWGVLHGWEMWLSRGWSTGGDHRMWLSGNDSLTFWRDLACCARINGTVWVFAWDVWPAWCLLNGVKEVAEGRLILDIRQENDDKLLPGERPRRSTGLFVAENPPTIICLAVPGGGRIKIVDLANYGITQENYGIDGDAGSLAATVQATKDYHRLCKTYDLGGCQTTAAAQAWYCYRRSHMKSPVIVHPIEKALDLERAAYYGGRCECRRLGKFSETLYHVDVNSMYTSLGCLSRFPSRYVACADMLDGKRHIPYSDEKLMIADVTVKVDTPYYPCREKVKIDPGIDPRGRRGRERVIYPVGRFRTALCGPELGFAVQAGHVVEWHRVQYYQPEFLMRHWSNWALLMRDSLSKNGFKHLSGCCKKIINSLPGKWGQRIKAWRDFESANDFNADGTEDKAWFMEWGKHPGTGGLTQYRTIAGQTQYMDDEELCSTSCPSIAGFWTSYGRMHLNCLIIAAEDENVYYYDTDSLIVNQKGMDLLVGHRMINANAPGLLKVKESSNDVEILGIRRYRFGPRWCVAGPFGGVISGSTPSPEWEEHEGFGGQLWHASVGDPVRVKRKARWKKEYHHGFVEEDGRVTPFLVGIP